MERAGVAVKRGSTVHNKIILVVDSIQVQISAIAFPLFLPLFSTVSSALPCTILQ